ncbi:MAG: patatin-like phospholipase family protein [Sedimenticola sp.]|nr:patatin-like phospholipase family protein [Sedimenticola sp.]
MAEHSIDLALQGGGSHGAFTWGVLDRLLADSEVRIGGLSGTSAGAMNAVVLASGFGIGGRQGAREALTAFWKAVSRVGSHSMLRQTPLNSLFEPWIPNGSPMLKFFDVMSRLISPYQLNPWNINPLRDLLVQHVDFDLINKIEEPKVFVNATKVSTGNNRIFRNADISLDAVLASACLPFLFHAVEIENEAYWDGGYTANPALLPLIAESEPHDLILVQINPVERPGIPRTSHDIIDRINEISFNSSLNQELRSVALIKRLLKEEEDSGHSYKAPLFARIDTLFLHRIEAQKEMRSLGASSKLGSGWSLISRLHDIGYQAADTWLTENRQSLGQRSTIKLLDERANMSDDGYGGLVS